MKAPAGKTPPRGRPKVPATEPHVRRSRSARVPSRNGVPKIETAEECSEESQLRRSTRKRTPRSDFYGGTLICDNIRDYNLFTGNTPMTSKKVKTPSRVKKDGRRKSTSEMKILSKKAERKQLHSTPTKKDNSRRSSLYPKKLF